MCYDETMMSYYEEWEREQEYEDFCRYMDYLEHLFEEQNIDVSCDGWDIITAKLNINHPLSITFGETPDTIFLNKIMVQVVKKDDTNMAICTTLQTDENKFELIYFNKENLYDTIKYNVVNNMTVEFLSENYNMLISFIEYFYSEKVSEISRTIISKLVVEKHV